MEGIGEAGSWEGNAHDATSCWKVIQDMVEVEVKVKDHYQFMIKMTLGWHQE